ncbi:hypothetical protein ACH4UT_24485 [Streptomyces sp. NPDC020799]|uniref:hypothetical protein n=1 Tax=unclassified Streptomyces TaxID=2593676 RepID=UPI00340038AA
MTPNTSNPAIAYADAPSIIAEICWVAQQASQSFCEEQPDREFWLRKAAVLDRIAVKGTDMYVPELAAETVETAAQAARRLVEHDATQSGLSLKGAELVTDQDHREYVRHQYHQWLHAQHV